MALLAVAARELEIQGDGLNAMPLRLQLEFLDVLGAGLQPAKPARAPLVFKLLDKAAADAAVPAGTRVAAVLPPPPPSLDSNAPTETAAKPEFFTEREITAMRGRLAAVYSIDPKDDVYADHSADVTSGFQLFTDMAPVPHRLYLAHGELYRLGGTAEIVLTFDFATAGVNSAGVATRQRPLLLDWEYLSADGWLPLNLQKDETARFTRDGSIVLVKSCGPDAKQGVIFGHESCWIRGTIANRVPSARIVRAPAVGGLAFDVERAIELLPGDVVTVDGVSRATLVSVTDKTVRLDRLPSQVAAGEYLMLPDALPPLRPDGADEEGVLPQVDTIRTRVGFEKSDLGLDGAYLDGFTIDTSKDFYPFGMQPQRFASFSIACREAFSRSGARIELAFTFVALGGTVSAPSLVAEYFNGLRWTALGSGDDYIDGTDSFSAPPVSPTSLAPSLARKVKFVVPDKWVETEIDGDKNFWLRFRLASGDYGQPVAVSVAPDPNDPTKYIVNASPSTLVPPIVAELRAAYTVLSNPVPLDYCVTENDFAFTEHSEDARWPRRPFAPFVPVADRVPALHLGFTAKPPPALASVLVAVDAAAQDAVPQPLVWDYWGTRGWTELSVRDVTNGLRQTGMLQFVGAPDALPRDGVGGALYRIRARLKIGLSSVDYRTALRGMWLNAVWAVQGSRFKDTLGTSNGDPDQTYALPPARAAMPASGNAVTARDRAAFERALDRPVTGVPVMVDEAVLIREWVGRGDDWQTAVAGVPDEDLEFEQDPQDRSIKTAVWVRWHAQPHLFDSHAGDRHYVVERARGVFRFPGSDGFVPPAGCPIVVDYVTGGGIVGNVSAGTLTELRSGVGFVESVANPLPAAGGAEAELLRLARDRSAQSPRHRDRAVAAEDYEWLAREASGEVARARAVPLAGSAGSGSVGFIGLVLVPQSTDAAPLPSRELCAKVSSFLATRAPAGVAGGLRIIDPEYVRVGLRAEIVPCSAGEAGRVEARLRRRIETFLHPLAGGRKGLGWEFGAGVYLSDIAALLEETEGVDAVRQLQLMVGQTLFMESVPLAAHQLVAAGDSQLKLIVPSLAYAIT